MCSAIVTHRLSGVEPQAERPLEPLVRCAPFKYVLGGVLMNHQAWKQTDGKSLLRVAVFGWWFDVCVDRVRLHKSTAGWRFFRLAQLHCWYFMHREEAVAYGFVGAQPGQPLLLRLKALVRRWIPTRPSFPSSK